METAARQIVAFGGGGFSMESGNPLLDDYVLALTRAERPRVCFLPSASGDADHYIVRFYRAFSAHRCEASHISLFRREQGPEDLRVFSLVVGNGPYAARGVCVAPGAIETEATAHRYADPHGVQAPALVEERDELPEVGEGHRRRPGAGYSSA